MWPGASCSLLPHNTEEVRTLPNPSSKFTWRLLLEAGGLLPCLLVPKNIDGTLRCWGHAGAFCSSHWASKTFHCGVRLLVCCLPVCGAEGRLSPPAWLEVTVGSMPCPMAHLYHLFSFVSAFLFLYFMFLMLRFPLAHLPFPRFLIIFIVTPLPPPTAAALSLYISSPSPPPSSCSSSSLSVSRRNIQS